ncbi:hemagglutinin repeat-containing protein [Escherichia coli]|jgi:filamentous hemagglutinin|uniref:Hemagglutinin-related protein n=59 Tax=Enterobacteriaceae TaxID=543 RepID=A0A4C6ZJ63_ECOLX|nr:contact-dependent inhibition effector tRNA nuclease [Escherichia coli]EFJ2778347.1 filamentous hemagglutinin N-terminal domain-containing protein [Escherichia coli]EFN3789823.1 filamentous hemagglutinin N-terminal domain-containing protein [Escherichia coli]EHT4162755.1 contact-dependent inhibition effector tRNA nuclease [Escherichia coli]EKW2657277.1 contact-dependent inhibition effector tRNA nuclease [Escherichia coli]EQS75540.1 filamentous hemagglutinin [Escherichia coli HVH 162 (4-56279
MHQPPVRFTYRLLSYLISTIIAGQPLLPAVGAVITPQNGAGMDKAANGVPVVNIATPNGAGISHNRFTDYNVGKEGLILNNATGKLNPTQLGGLIQNNPNLKAGGEAKGIINEVTGGNRSLLQGYTEVAGKAANVMVANPYGITCDGCGFINTPHATLTTGRPVMNADGSLQALEVTEGSITINGAGLDGTRSDAVSIIARATEVNAALHAKDLTVTAGANRITADGRVSALKGEGDVPKVAVDTGALGGMYARRIHLTSTESGVGVNLGNLYAREGDIILSSAGKLVLKNSLAGGNTTVTGTDVSLSGDNKAGGNLSVTGTTGLTLNQPRLVTDKNLVLSSSGQIVQNGGELTAGQNAMLSAQHLNQTSGTVNAAENVTLTTTNDTTLKGRSIAGKTLTVSSGSLNNGGTLVAGRDATVKTGTFSNTGTVQGNGLKVTATDLTSTGSIKSGSTLDISARNATLSGDAGAKDSARVTVSGTLENRGRLVSDDVLTLSATQINNSGTLSGAKELVASADTLTTTEKSVTNSDGNLMLDSASSTLAGETSAGGTVSVKGNSLKTTTTAQTQGNSVSVDVQNAQLDGTQAARDILTLNASEKLTHSGKSSAPSLSLSAPELTSSGVLVGSALNTQSQTLTNSGLLQGKASLTVNTQRLDNQQNGTLYSAADLTLDIPDIRNSGLITGDNGLMLNAVSLSNPGKIIADTLSVRATTLDGDGLLQGAGALALAGDTLSQGRNGRWLTAGDLSLRGKTLHTAGTTQGQNLTVQADRWANSGSVLATGNLTASATGQLTSTGDIMSQGDTTLKAATTDNRGSLLSAGTLSLDGNSLDNSGTVQGNHVTIRQNSVTNSGTLTGIAALTLAARMASPQPALMNNGGSLLTSGDLTITAGSITSSGHWQGKRVLITADSLANSGAIQAADSLTARLTGELVSTAGSKVTSNGEMALSALNLSNSGQWIAKNLTLKANSLTSAGDITGVDTLTLTVNQTLNNQANGKLLSAGVLTLKADSVTNDGQLQGNATTITAGQLTNGGHLQGETLTLAASGGVNNRSGGVLMSRNALNVSTATLSNQGTIQGGGGVSLNATDRLQNDGKILSGSNLTLTAQLLANTGSGLVQAATLLLDVVNTVNGGRVLATGSADVKGTTLNNTGTLQGADLLVNYHTFSNSGTLLGTSGLGVKGSSLLQNGTGRLYSAGNLLLDAQDFSGQGQVVATGDVTLKLIAALTNHGTLAAGKTLSVTSQNAITNGGVMQGDAMVLGAGEAFTNNGMLTAGKGNSVFSAQRLFLNAPGSLQAGGDVSLNSRSDITISGFTGTAGSLTMNVAGTLLNSALIYAGNNLKLFTDRLHNQHGDILAGNSLWVQKDASGGANTEIINTSGNIETHQGDIVVRTGHLLNQREGFSATTTTRTNPSSIQGMGNALVDIPLSLLPDGSYGYFTREVENQHGTPCNGHGACNITMDTLYYYAPFADSATQRFLSSQNITTVTGADNPAGRIASGRNLSAEAERLENRASFILANGDIALSGRELSNQSWQTGTENEYLVYRYDPKTFYGSYATGSLDKLPLLSPEFENNTIRFSLDGREKDYTPGKTYYSVIQAGGDVKTRFTSSINNGTTTAHAGSVSPVVSAPVLNTLSQQTGGDSLTQTALQQYEPVVVGSPQWHDELAGALKNIAGGSPLTGQTGISDDWPLPSGNNGYLVPSTDPDSPYLITVNPKLDGLGQVDSHLFAGLYELLGAKPGQAPRETAPSYTDEKQFLGSSYFLDRLGLKPEKDYRFLGDAVFDTRYVSNAVLSRTGSRYLNGLGSDTEQMRYLMDNAARQQKGLGLEFGVALTAEQIAQLDGSILWWESVTINGQTVMVPKLYLSPEDITLHNGSVISGNNVQLAGGNITNSGGSINAQNDLSLDSTGYIDNLNAGLISAGGSLDLSAIGDISNISSVISGKTVQLESVSGNISNITRRQQWNAGSDGRYGGVHLSGTDTGPVATIKGTDSLSLDAGKNIDITGATVSSGGTLGMSAGNDINIAANLISGSKSQSGFWHTDDNSASSTTSQGSSISAGGNLAMAAGHNLDVTASSVSAGHSALLSAGNDLSLNAVRESKNSRNGRSESHESHAAVSTVTAGDNLLLVAGRDVASQAAGVAAENNVVIRGGRDVNLVAESAGAGDSYTSKKKKEINETVRQQGTEIASGGDTTVNAGRDITAVASSVTATGNISVNAGRDVALTTATESDYHYLETKKKSGGFLSKKTTHTISEDSASREAGSLLSGNRVTVNAGDNLTVEGSDVVADQDVSLAAGNHVDVLAATSTDTSWRFKETKKSGLMGTGGIGFTIGSSKTTHDRREAGTTQSQSASTIGSTAGNVSITAGKQAHISGSDVIANRDISITGDSVVVDPGHDRRTVDEKFEQKKSGLTVALSGTVGSAINNAVTSAQETKESSDSRLKALQATKTALSGVQAGQAAAMATATGDPNATGVSLSLTTQKSKSQQHSESDTVSGSTLNAGNNLSVVATGKNRGDNRGDIVIAGSQLKAGGNTSLDAANDILLSGAANTQKTTGRNSSSGGGVGVSIGAGKGAGISVFASVNAAKGREKGNGTEWTETTTDSGKTLTINSGRDTVLNGAQVNGNRIIADVGHDLLISSQQDTSKYDSKQTSVAAGGSFTFGSMTGSGYIAASRDKMKSRFDSVAEQTGMFAGDGGFDITVGRHTQLDGAVIASTATADKNSLDTGTLGFSDIHNEADFKTQHSGISISGAGSFGDQFKGNMPGGMISAAGNSGHAEGTTQAAVADGTITIRDKDNQKQDVANLSRDTEHANDSISPIFDKEKEQNRLKEIGMISDIGGQVADIARTQGELNALKVAQDKYGPLQADATEEQRQAYLAKLRETPEYKKEQEKFGTGSDIQRGIQAATAALQGLAGGNLAGALAGASAPELANFIGHNAGINDNDAAKAIAHAILGGVTAALQGNNAAAGSVGAVSGELIAGAIAKVLYPDEKDLSKLTEDQKQTLSTLASISAGMAGGVAGGNTAGVATGAAAGKNVVENNLLGGNEDTQTKFVQEHGKDIASCSTNPGGAECKRGEAVNKAIAAALVGGATGGVVIALTPEAIAAAQAAVSACGANTVLCANEVSIWVAEMVAGDALPAGLTVAAVGKMSASELSELKALMAVEKQTGQKISAESLEKLMLDSGGKGNWSKELNNPQPNKVYHVDGDKIYKTDAQARPSQVEATLSPNVKDRNGYQQCKAGKCGLDGDEGGHLIASIFNGPGEKLNLVPMDGNLNKGAWKQMENTWAKALGEGKEVKVNIQPSYIGDSVRPAKFKVVYSIDGGRPIEKVFNNAPGGK